MNNLFFLNNSPSYLTEWTCWFSEDPFKSFAKLLTFKNSEERYIFFLKKLYLNKYKLIHFSSVFHCSVSTGLENDQATSSMFLLAHRVFRWPHAKLSKLLILPNVLAHFSLELHCSKISSGFHKIFHLRFFEKHQLFRPIPAKSSLQKMIIRCTFLGSQIHNYRKSPAYHFALRVQ